MNGNLAALIKSVLAQHPSAGPEELALCVAQATPAADVRTYYAHLLIGACRTVVNKERRGGKPAPKPVAAKKKPSSSPKLQQRRSWWAEMLASEMHVGDGKHKTMADCTVADLRFCIEERDRAVGRIEEQMSNLQRLVTMMVARNARIVSDLPEQQQWRNAS